MKTMTRDEYNKYMDTLPRCATLGSISKDYGCVVLFTKYANPMDELLFDEPTEAEIEEGKRFIEENKNIRIRFDKETGLYQMLKRESKQHEAVVSAVRKLVAKIEFEKENWI